MSFRSFTDDGERMALSPDAALAAFGVSDSEKWVSSTHSGFLRTGAPGFAAGSELWLRDLQNDEEKILTSDWGSSWGPRWRPDSQAFAFYSDRDGSPKIWVWNRESGESSLVCDEPICVRFGFEGIHWLPDSTHLITKLRAPGWAPPETETEDSLRTRDVWESPPQERPQLRSDEGWHWYDRCRGDIALINTYTGKATRLGTEIFPLGISVSPDGSYVAALCLSGELDSPKGNILQYDLHLYSVDGSRRKVFAPGVIQASGMMLTWSPDSSTVACISSEPEHGGVRFLSIDGSDSAIEGRTDLSLENKEGYPPLWARDASKVYCWANGGVQEIDLRTDAIRCVTQGLRDYFVFGMFHSLNSGIASDFGNSGAILVMARHRATMQEGLYRIEDTHPVCVVQDQNRLLVRFLLYGDNQRDWCIGQIEDAASPPDLFAVNVRSGEEKRLTALNPAAATGPRQTVMLEYPGPEDRKLRGALFLPLHHQPGDQCSTVIEVYYGAMQSGYVNAFGTHNSVWLTACGYGVFLPDLPRLGCGPADAISSLVEAAADAVVEQGYADPDALGLIGGSLGGYSVNCTITRSTRFKAAVAVASYSDLVSFSLTLSGNAVSGSRWLETYPMDLGGPPWEIPGQYLENSPVTRLDDVTTPLLLLHGTADKAVPIHQAEEILPACCGLGRPRLSFSITAKDIHPLNGRKTTRGTTGSESLDGLIGSLDEVGGATKERWSIISCECWRLAARAPRPNLLPHSAPRPRWLASCATACTRYASARNARRRRSPTTAWCRAGRRSAA